MNTIPVAVPAQPSLFLITGIMASGKSTVAQLLAERFERGVHVRGDVFRRMIVSGREEMLPEPSDEAIRQLHLRYRLAAAAADAYVEAGFHTVVQDVIVGPELSTFIDFVKTRPLYVIVLCPRAEAVAARESSRSKQGYGIWTVDVLDRILRHDSPRLGMWLDTSDLTPEETVREIERRAWTEAIVRA
ncbi:MAG: AAA family ATPase [Paenibacillus dendritiformis]|uniref:AAA family ATPase n=1 Tax=uncultured Paenibacillus sp. TaxID=227322 RepID=UPI0025F4A9D2|nr:AAA family ATPase [uncultured Paenibacillus sp.]MDU5143309.1 AAA family ATPase [Paenibacillus dendritiformis]